MLHRLFCCAAALGWSIASLGLFVDSATAFDWLGRLAGQPIIPQPMLDYWLRMTAAAFTLIGFLFAWVAFDRVRMAPLAMVLALFQILCGGVLAWWAWSLGIPAARCAADILFCVVTGGGILAASLMADNGR
jgi:hypothetical protein